jgi:hypothetical protein
MCLNNLLGTVSANVGNLILESNSRELHALGVQEELQMIIDVSSK